MLANRRLVIDAPMRMFHWLFALSFAGAYATADSDHWRLVHVTLGYTLAGLLGFRLLCGVVGPRSSALGVLVRKLTGALPWVRSAWRAPTPQGVNWRQGQNLLMSAAVALLLLAVLPLTLSGYAIHDEWANGWGGEALEELHEWMGNAMLAVALVHIALIAGLSALRRKNQGLPMLTGRVEGPGPDLVQSHRRWLAALLLGCVVGFIAWQLISPPAGARERGAPTRTPPDATEHRGHHRKD
jgi:cytochrome b